MSAIATWKQTNIDDVKREGQEFTGLSYVTNLNIRKLQDTSKGLAFYSNKTSDIKYYIENRQVLYITDDNYIHIGGRRDIT